MTEHARRYCLQTVEGMQNYGTLTSDMEAEAHSDLSTSALKEKDWETAKSHVEKVDEIVDIGSVELTVWKYLALGKLAIIHEKSSNFEAALNSHKRSLGIVTKLYGREDCTSLDSFVRAIKFCRRHGLDDHEIRLKAEHSDVHNHLEYITDGLWDMKLDDRPRKDKVRDYFENI